MKDTETIEQVVYNAWNWLVATYQTEGLVGLIVVLAGGTIIFGGMGAIFWAAAKANTEGLEKK